MLPGRQELGSRGAELEAANRKMAQELAEYQAEAKELKNQGGTIRRLEERVRALEAQLQERVGPPFPALLGGCRPSQRLAPIASLHSPSLKPIRSATSR